MIQNRTSVESSSFQNNINDISSKNSINIINKRNTNESIERNENELLSNSVTSISSNKDCYNNFVSKIKLNYNLNNPKERTQTIILHTSLNKSYSDLNDSLTINEYNNEQKYDNLSKNQNLKYNLNNNNNYEGKNFDQLNNGFFLDNSSQYFKNINNLNKNDLYNNKRDTLNNINNLYENENIMGNSDLNDNNNNQSDKVKKDKVTINFNNNMFFVNDNNKSKETQNKYQNFPLDNIFNNYKKTSEDTFKNKVFLSNNDFDDNYPGIKKNENNKNHSISLPYGYQNNAFCGPNQNRNNQKEQNFYDNNKNNIINSNQIEQKPASYNFNNKDNSSLNDLSTNLNTNNDNLDFGQNNNNNKNISPFNYGDNNSSTHFLQNVANSLIDLNNNKNNDNINQNDKLNMKLSFNPNNNNNNDNANQNLDKNYTSKIFPNLQDNNIPNNMNNQNYLNNNENNNNNNDINDKESNNDNSENSSEQKLEDNTNYYPQLKNDLIQSHLLQNNDYNNNELNNNKNNFNNNKNDNIFQRGFTFNPNSYNLNNNNNDEIKQNNQFYPLDINQNNNEQKFLAHGSGYDGNSLRTSIDNNENIEINKNLNNKNYYLLRSLLYGLLFGSTTTVLFWLRKEETRQYLMKKYSRVNFGSIINLFKSILFPVEFFQKILSKEKREVYLKVLGITFGKFYDFLEQYGDGFRLLGVFLSIYGIWFIIKSLIKMAIKWDLKDSLR